MIADIPVRHEGQRRTAVLALPPDATQQSQRKGRQMVAPGVAQT